MLAIRQIDQAAIEAVTPHRIDTPLAAVGAVTVERLVSLPMGFGDRAATGFTIHAVAIPYGTVNGSAQAGLTVHVGLAAVVLGTFVLAHVLPIIGAIIAFAI